MQESLQYPIDNKNSIVFSNHNIGGFDVAMQNSFVVGIGDGATYGMKYLEELSRTPAIGCIPYVIILMNHIAIPVKVKSIRVAPGNFTIWSHIKRFNIEGE